jgi:cytochrome P450
MSSGNFPLKTSIQFDNLACMTTLEDYTVEFVPLQKRESLKKWLFAFPKNFFQGIYNTYLLAKHRNVLQPLEKNHCPFKWIWKFTSPFFSGKITSQSHIMKAVLKHPRTDSDDGLFFDTVTDRLFLFILKDLFPNEPVTKNDFLFTAHKDFVNQYRQPILRFIGQRNIHRHSEKIESIVKKTVDAWGKGGDKINASLLSFAFASNTISKFLLNHPGPEEVFEEISRADQCLLNVMMKKGVWRKSLSKQEQKEYEHALEVFRKAVDIALTQKSNDSDSFIQMLREEKGMTELQVKSTLFLMYFAGVDAPGSVLSYTLWQLGKMPDYQDEILAEIKGKEGSLYEIASQLKTVENLYNEGLRLFTPIYLISRYPTKDLLCVVKDKTGNILLQEPLSKQKAILCCPFFAARDSQVFENPEQFNPHRYSSPLKTHSWLPFGDGKHLCPGQWIAKAEITVFITQLIQKYTIQSFPEKEPKRKGYLTIQTESPFWLSLKPR